MYGKCGVLLLIISSFTLTAVGEEALRFQTTAEEFVEALQGVETKGPAMVSPDNPPQEYEKLMKQPNARALILFDFDSASITEQSYPLLENLAVALKPGMMSA
jgi:outer membrane protein OmpA-like peptidoglycan-associated protein